MSLVGPRVEGLGQGTRAVLSRWGHAARFTFSIVNAESPALREVRQACATMLVPALLPVLAVSTFIGATATLMGYHAFFPLGTQAQIGSFAGLLSVRELSPLLTGAMIAAKIGTAFTATVAAMRSSEQIDALETMGVDSFGYLLVPKILGLLLVAAPLVVFSDAMALVSSYGTAVLELRIPPGGFEADLFRFVDPTDVAVGILKVTVFAALTGGISAYFGYFAAVGPRGVSRAVTRAMVAMAISIVLANGALSWLFYR